MKLPRDLDGATLVTALRPLGYEVTRQAGSHVRLTTRLGGEHHVTIPAPWQVNGRSDVVDFEEVVRYDREYIEHWSLPLDVQIMMKTIPVLFSRSGAY